jgi:hypothetical protein
MLRRRGWMSLGPGAASWPGWGVMKGDKPALIAYAVKIRQARSAKRSDAH